MTPKEREWLLEHDAKIVLAHDPSAKPIDFIDENGEFRGLAADYVELIEKRLNFKFNIVHLETWDEVVRRAKNREIDVLCTFTKNPQREKWMLFTEPYIEIPTVILTRKNIKGNLTLDKMKNMKVTFTKGWVIDDFLRNNYGYLDMLPAINENTAMNYVSTGQADAWVTVLTAASIQIEENKITNLRVAGETELSFKLAMASRKDWPVLHNILKKGLALITDEERSSIFDNWIHIESKSIVSSRTFWTIVLTVVAIALLPIIIIFTWNRTLKKQVEHRTNALEHELNERKRAEEALSASEEKYRSIVETAASLITSVNKKGIIVDCNPQIEEFLGYTKEEIIGQSMAKIIHPDYMQKAAESLKEVFVKGTSRNKEYKMVRKDGAFIYVNINSSGRKNDQGEDVRISCIINDITQRKEAEEAMRALMEGTAVVV